MQAASVSVATKSIVGFQKLSMTSTLEKLTGLNFLETSCA
jgi:hypothetical protein